MNSRVYKVEIENNCVVLVLHASNNAEMLKRIFNFVLKISRPVRIVKIQIGK